MKEETIQKSKEEYALIKSFWQSSDYRRDFFYEYLSKKTSPEDSIAATKKAIKESRIKYQFDWGEPNRRIVEIHVENFEKDQLGIAKKFISIYERIENNLYKYQYDNVYDAAIGMILSQGIFSINSQNIRPSSKIFERPAGQYNLEKLLKTDNLKESVSGFYRGLSSNQYKNLSPINRPESKSSIVSEKLLAKRHYRIEHFRNYLREKDSFYLSIFGDSKPEHREFLELAFMQHFKEEAKLSPPLLDITYDPLVALYFASSSPKSGTMGIVLKFYIRDVRNLAELAGACLSVAVLPSVTRLINQRALILDNLGIGDLERTVPYELSFKQ